jgi:beta-glucosidase
MHNLLRSHAKAVQAYRASGSNQIGLVVNLEPKYPASDSADDAAAVKRADAYMNRQYLDPVFLGSYPQELIDGYGEAWPEISAADLEEIRTPFDFLGINYYKRGITKADDSVIIERATRVDNPRATVTETGWEVFAEGLTRTLTWVRDRYGDLPLYITENGAAFYDPPVAFNGRIDDPLRVDYLRDHIRAVRTAMRQGVNVRGYYVWSLLDNFEWALGYAKRFGIIHVDYETLKRTPKASARYYADVIKARMAI